FRTNDLRLSAIEHEDGEGLKGPRLMLFKDGDFNSLVIITKNKEEQVIVSQKMTVSSDEKGQILPTVNQLTNKTDFKPLYLRVKRSSQGEAMENLLYKASRAGKIVFHVVTDSLNYPAISMWFLLNIQSRATIQILNIDDMDVLPPDYDQLLMKQNSNDPRFISPLNHARFYLPDIFPGLKKIVLFDHDVVVQRDLSRLWSIDMKGKVVGAVETCLEVLELAHGRSVMNLIDLEEWRIRKLTSTYIKYFNLGTKRPLWKAGSLPIGRESGVKAVDIEQAAVIHYDGVMKPWLDIGKENYKRYWNTHVPYHHTYLQQCNLQA
ncbi:hypothetical protein ISN44_Un25g000130, partial [Arabidopsis suecica]